MYKQNFRFWGTENPRVLHHHQLHHLRCTAWCVIMADRIIGPYFCEDDDEHAENVTGASYRTMLENYLRLLVENNHDIWFQQGGETAHTANATMVMLKELFDDCIISKKSNFAWPPRLTDLSQLISSCGDI